VIPGKFSWNSVKRQECPKYKEGKREKAKRKKITKKLKLHLKLID
jgi:hypothetical protein